MKPDPAGATSAQISLREYLEAKIEAERELNRNFRDAKAEEFRVFKEGLSREIKEAALNVSERLKLLNELRAEVLSDRANFITKDKYDADMMGRNLRIDSLEKWQTGIMAAGLPAVVSTHAVRLKAVEDWRNKLLGIGVVIALFAGLVGALLMRLLSSVFVR